MRAYLLHVDFDNRTGMLLYIHQALPDLLLSVIDWFATVICPAFQRTLLEAWRKKESKRSLFNERSCFKSDAVFISNGRSNCSTMHAKLAHVRRPNPIQPITWYSLLCHVAFCHCWCRPDASALEQLCSICLHAINLLICVNFHTTRKYGHICTTGHFTCRPGENLNVRSGSTVLYFVKMNVFFLWVSFKCKLCKTDRHTFHIPSIARGLSIPYTIDISSVLSVFPLSGTVPLRSWYSFRFWISGISALIHWKWGHVNKLKKIIVWSVPLHRDINCWFYSWHPPSPCGDILSLP